MFLFSTKIKSNKSVICLALAALFASSTGYSKVHWNKPVGTFKHSHHISECTGRSLMVCMEEKVYPAIKAAASMSGNQGFGGHVRAIQYGVGAELVLTDNISTYHVKYKKHTGDYIYDRDNVQKSGRSFSAVEFKNGRAVYLADASYKHYFTWLQDLMDDTEELEKFYRAILLVVANSDPSGFYDLGQHAQRVATDFVAVYIAEQYRRMVPTDGDGIADSQQWDNALMQTTLLAAFHAGQSEFTMFFRGQFSTKTANLVRNYYNSNTPLTLKAHMTAYTQLGRTKGSGVNVTRKDFSKMGREITKTYNGYPALDSLSQAMGGYSIRGNAFNAITLRFVSNSAPSSFTNPEAMVNGIVEFLMDVNYWADAITDSIKYDN